MGIPYSIGLDWEKIYQKRINDREKRLDQYTNTAKKRKKELHDYSKTMESLYKASDTSITTPEFYKTALYLLIQTIHDHYMEKGRSKNDAERIIKHRLDTIDGLVLELNTREDFRKLVFEEWLSLRDSESLDNKIKQYLHKEGYDIEEAQINRALRYLNRK